MQQHSTLSETTADAVARAEQQAEALELEHARRIEHARNRPTFARVRDRDEAARDLEHTRRIAEQLKQLETRAHRAETIQRLGRESRGGPLGYHEREQAGESITRAGADLEQIDHTRRALEHELDAIVRRRATRSRLAPLPPSPQRRRAELMRDVHLAKADERTAAARRRRAELELDALEADETAEQLEKRARARARLTGAELEHTTAADVDRAGALRIRAAELELELEQHPRDALTAGLEQQLERVANELEQLEQRAARELEPALDELGELRRRPLTITEAELERRLDVDVQRRLQHDPRYRNAENADQQANAEHAIELEAELELLRRLHQGGETE